MSGTVHLRLSGELADITAVLADLVGSRTFCLDVDPRTYPNRGGGVRVYTDLTVERSVMQAGFVLETVVVAYCHGCGDYYEPDEGPVAFRSREAAVQHFASGLGGWYRDGDRLLCDFCHGQEGQS